MYLPSATICLHSVQPVHSLKAPGAQCVGQSQWHHEVHGSACTTGRRCCKKINTKGDAAHHAPWHCRMVCRNVASPSSEDPDAVLRRRSKATESPRRALSFDADRSVTQVCRKAVRIWSVRRLASLYQVRTHARTRHTHRKKLYYALQNWQVCFSFRSDAKPLRPSHAHRRHARPSSPRTHAFAAPLELTTG